MPDEVRVRLLICGVCKTIEELPWYEGPQEGDDTGNYRLSFHRFHGSGNYHPYAVGDVAKKDWDKQTYREAMVSDITAQIEGRKDGGLGSEFYDVKANFKEDAFACWKRHSRTTDCADYKTDRMRLLPDTRAERRAEGLNPKSRPNTFLCQFCPVNSLVVTRQRAARGDYDKQPWETI